MFVPQTGYFFHLPGAPGASAAPISRGRFSVPSETGADHQDVSNCINHSISLRTSPEEGKTRRENVGEDFGGSAAAVCVLLAIGAIYASALTKFT